MFLKLTKLMSVLFFATLSFSTYADPVYTASVPVASQSAETREQAVGEALKQVLQKVSGIFDDSLISPVLEKLPADRLLHQYTYQTLPKDEVHSDAAYLLTASFDKKAITSAMLGLGLPVLGDNRPTSILWLTIDDAGAREILGTTMEAPSLTALQLKKELASLSSQYGVPIILPILDLADVAKVSPSDVWGQFREPILAASQRYKAPSVVVGKLYQHKDGRWLGQWLLTGAGKDVVWSTQSFNTKETVQQLFERLSGELTNRYAVYDASQQSDEELLLNIDNVDNISDYAKISDYLERLTVVKAVEIQEIAPPKLIMKLTLNGQRKVLEDTLRLSKLLQQTDYQAHYDEALDVTYQP